MQTAKAKYLGNGAGHIGDGSGKMARPFSSQLRATLRSYYPQQDAATCPHFGNPADNFVEQVLGAAGNAAADMMWQEFNVTKQELRAEQKDVLKSLNATQNKLRKLSPPFRWLLEDGAAPLRVADSLDAIIRQIEATALGIGSLPIKRGSDAERHDIAIEMAFRVLHVLKDNDIEISATCGSYNKLNDITTKNYNGTDVSQYISDAVKILKAIGDDIGLGLANTTWRDIIIEAKKSCPDLQ